MTAELIHSLSPPAFPSPGDGPGRGGTSQPSPACQLSGLVAAVWCWMGVSGCFAEAAQASGVAGGSWGLLAQPGAGGGEGHGWGLVSAFVVGGIVLTHLALVGSVRWGWRSPTAGGIRCQSRGGHAASKGRKFKSISLSAARPTHSPGGSPVPPGARGWHPVWG